MNTLLNKLTLILSILLIPNLFGGDFSLKLKMVPTRLRIPARRANESFDEATAKFYENLQEALIDHFINHDKALLKKLSGRIYTFQTLSVMLKKLVSNKVFGDTQIIIINNDHLGSFEFNLFQLINYLMFICKITDTIITQFSTDKNLSIFSDDVFTNPLILFLFVSSLNELGYKSITMTTLTGKGTSHDRLDDLIFEQANINFTLNQYFRFSDLINSNTKIDLYLTNLTFSSEQYYFKCICEKRAKKLHINSTESNRNKIYVTYSKIADTPLFISTKLYDQASLNIRNKIFKKLIRKLYHQTGNSNQKIIDKYTCKLLPSAEVTLADLIYLTHRKLGKKSVPLFVYSYREKDTIFGIIADNTIIETNLSNVENYKELLCSILKTNVNLSQEDITRHSANLQAFAYDQKTDSFIVYKNSLNIVESKVTTFLRTWKSLFSGAASIY